MFNKKSTFSQVIHSITFQAIQLAFAWVSFAFLISTLVSKTAQDQVILQLVLAFIVIYWVGRHFIFNAVRELIKDHRVNVSGAVLISSQICFMFSIYMVVKNYTDPDFIFDHYYFVEGVALITFVMSGDLITDTLQIRIQRKIDLVKDIKITTAHLYDPKTKMTTRTTVENIVIGDQILVPHNEPIPLDGKCYSQLPILVNETIITGESRNVKKRNYDKVIGGTTNVGPDFILEVIQKWEDGMVNNMIQRAEEIALQKPKLQHLSDKILNWFVPVVLTISIITFVTQYFVGYDLNQILHYYKNWTSSNRDKLDYRLQWSISSMVSVLMVACPCSLGLAIPLAVIIGLAKSHTIGATFTNIQTFEQIQRIKVLAVDKTGTVTAGKMDVQNIWGDKQHLGCVYQMELNSSHPLARAFTNYYEAKYKVKADHAACVLKNVKEKIGYGVSATLNDDKVAVIGLKQALNHGYTYIPMLKTDLDFQRSQKEPITKVAVVINGKITNIIGFGDTVRENAASTVQWFKDNGVEIVMLTGDSLEPARYISQQIGIEKYYANMSPEDKSKKIEELKIEHKGTGAIAYVGDGFNDLIALRQADLGIAVGESYTNVAASADIILTNSDIATVAKAYKLTKFTRKIIIFNLLWGFSYNIITVPLAFIGIIPPIFSALFMSLSTVVLVLLAIFFTARKITLK